jgi:hypothetical protein
MKFCPNCGTQLQAPNPKFCPECGTNLQVNLASESASNQATTRNEPQVQRTVAEPDVDQELEPAKLNVYDLGVKLEGTTAAIFEKMGYSVKMRQRPPTKSGGAAEIDILLERGSRRKAVECKNYGESRWVGVSELRVFKDKLADTGIAAGVFVTNTAFSDDARKLAESTGIELWDGKELRERFFAYAIGRIRNPSLVQDPILPLQMDFGAASEVAIRNGQAIHLFSTVLLYHPYVQVKYRLQATRTDPTGKSHTIADSATYYVDALDGDIINREKSVLESLGGFLRKKEERLASREDKMVTEDLESITPETKSVLSTSDYQVSVAEAGVTEEDAIKIVKSYVIEKNRQEINYKIRVRGELETRSLKVVPRPSEVSIRGTRLVYVPKWNLEYESGQTSFSRRFLASSGRALEDELAKCSDCTLLKRATVVVCEECGRPLCDKHSYQEGRWLCGDHISDVLRQQVKGSGLLSKFKLGRS